MANALKGKSTVFMTFIAPNSDAAETLRLFFENHFEFMKEKSHKAGALKLINYYISESPEWLNDGPYTAGPAPFLRVNSLIRQGESFLFFTKFY